MAAAGISPEQARNQFEQALDTLITELRGLDAVAGSAVLGPVFDRFYRKITASSSPAWPYFSKKLLKIQELALSEKGFDKEVLGDAFWVLRRKYTVFLTCLPSAQKAALITADPAPVAAKWKLFGGGGAAAPKTYPELARRCARLYLAVLTASNTTGVAVTVTWDSVHDQVKTWDEPRLTQLQTTLESLHAFLKTEGPASRQKAFTDLNSSTSIDRVCSAEYFLEFKRQAALSQAIALYNQVMSSPVAAPAPMIRGGGRPATPSGTSSDSDSEGGSGGGGGGEGASAAVDWDALEAAADEKIAVDKAAGASIPRRRDSDHSDSIGGAPERKGSPLGEEMGAATAGGGGGGAAAPDPFPAELAVALNARSEAELHTLCNNLKQIQGWLMSGRAVPGAAATGGAAPEITEAERKQQFARVYLAKPEHFVPKRSPHRLTPATLADEGGFAAFIAMQGRMEHLLAQYRRLLVVPADAAAQSAFFETIKNFDLAQLTHAEANMAAIAGLLGRVITDADQFSTEVIAYFGQTANADGLACLSNGTAHKGFLTHYIVAQYARVLAVGAAGAQRVLREEDIAALDPSQLEQIVSNLNHFQSKIFGLPENAENNLKKIIARAYLKDFTNFIPQKLANSQGYYYFTEWTWGGKTGRLPLIMAMCQQYAKLAGELGLDSEIVIAFLEAIKNFDRAKLALVHANLDYVEKHLLPSQKSAAGAYARMSETAEVADAAEAERVAVIRACLQENDTSPAKLDLPNWGVAFRKAVDQKRCQGLLNAINTLYTEILKKVVPTEAAPIRRPAAASEGLDDDEVKPSFEVHAPTGARRGSGRFLDAGFEDTLDGGGGGSGGGTAAESGWVKAAPTMAARPTPEDRIQSAFGKAERPELEQVLKNLEALQKHVSPSEDDTGGAAGAPAETADTKIKKAMVYAYLSNQSLIRNLCEPTAIGAGFGMLVVQAQDAWRSYAAIRGSDDALQTFIVFIARQVAIATASSVNVMSTIASNLRAMAALQPYAKNHLEHAQAELHFLTSPNGLQDFYRSTAIQLYKGLNLDQTEAAESTRGASQRGTSPWRRVRIVDPFGSTVHGLTADALKSFCKNLLTFQAWLSEPARSVEEKAAVIAYLKSNGWLARLQQANALDEYIHSLAIQKGATFAEPRGKSGSDGSGSSGGQGGGGGASMDFPAHSRDGGPGAPPAVVGEVSAKVCATLIVSSLASLPAGAATTSLQALYASRGPVSGAQQPLSLEELAQKLLGEAESAEKQKPRFSTWYPQNFYAPLRANYVEFAEFIRTETTPGQEEKRLAAFLHIAALSPERLKELKEPGAFRRWNTEWKDTLQYAACFQPIVVTNEIATGGLKPEVKRIIANILALPQEKWVPDYQFQRLLIFYGGQNQNAKAVQGWFNVKQAAALGEWSSIEGPPQIELFTKQYAEEVRKVRESKARGRSTVSMASATAPVQVTAGLKGALRAVNVAPPTTADTAKAVVDALKQYYQENKKNWALKDFLMGEQFCFYVAVAARDMPKLQPYVEYISTNWTAVHAYLIWESGLLSRTPPELPVFDTTATADGGGSGGGGGSGLSSVQAGAERTAGNQGGSWRRGAVVLGGGETGTIPNPMGDRGVRVVAAAAAADAAVAPSPQPSSAQGGGGRSEDVASGLEVLSAIGLGVAAQQEIARVGGGRATSPVSRPASASGGGSRAQRGRDARSSSVGRRGPVRDLTQAERDDIRAAAARRRDTVDSRVATPAVLHVGENGDVRGTNPMQARSTEAHALKMGQQIQQSLDTIKAKCKSPVTQEQFKEMLVAEVRKINDAEYSKKFLTTVSGAVMPLLVKDASPDEKKAIIEGIRQRLDTDLKPAVPSPQRHASVTGGASGGGGAAAVTGAAADTGGGGGGSGGGGGGAAVASHSAIMTPVASQAGTAGVRSTGRPGGRKAPIDFLSPIREATAAQCEQVDAAAMEAVEALNTDEAVAVGAAAMPVEESRDAVQRALFLEAGAAAAGDGAARFSDDEEDADEEKPSEALLSSRDIFCQAYNTLKGYYGDEGVVKAIDDFAGKKIEDQNQMKDRKLKISLRFFGAHIQQLVSEYQKTDTSEPSRAQRFYQLFLQKLTAKWTEEIRPARRPPSAKKKQDAYIDTSVKAIGGSLDFAIQMMGGLIAQKKAENAAAAAAAAPVPVPVLAAAVAAPVPIAAGQWQRLVEPVVDRIDDGRSSTTSVASDDTVESAVAAPGVRKPGPVLPLFGAQPPETSVEAASPPRSPASTVTEINANTPGSNRAGSADSGRGSPVDVHRASMAALASPARPIGPEVAAITANLLTAQAVFENAGAAAGGASLQSADSAGHTPFPFASAAGAASAAGNLFGRSDSGVVTVVPVEAAAVRKEGAVAAPAPAPAALVAGVAALPREVAALRAPPLADASGALGGSGAELGEIMDGSMMVLEAVAASSEGAAPAAAAVRRSGSVGVGNPLHGPNGGVGLALAGTLARSGSVGDRVTPGDDRPTFSRAGSVYGEGLPINEETKARSAAVWSSKGGLKSDHPVVSVPPLDAAGHLFSDASPVRAGTPASGGTGGAVPAGSRSGSVPRKGSILGRYSPAGIAGAGTTPVAAAVAGVVAQRVALFGGRGRGK